MLSDVTFNKAREYLRVYRHKDGYLKCRERLGRGKIPFDTKEPILLLNSHQFTDLLIKDMHEKIYHNEVQETLTQVRSLFWIPKGRQTVKKVIKEYLLCNRLDGLSYPPPAQSDLLEFRAIGGRAF